MAKILQVAVVSVRWDISEADKDEPWADDPPSRALIPQRYLDDNVGDYEIIGWLETVYGPDDFDCEPRSWKDTGERLTLRIPKPESASPFALHQDKQVASIRRALHNPHIYAVTVNRLGRTKPDPRYFT